MPTLTHLYGTSGDDYLYNYDVAVRYDAQEGSDYIENWVDYSKLFGNQGEDSIYNYGQHVFIDGGTKADLVVSEGDYATIWGKWGYDTIYNFGDYSIVNGDAGNDTIHNNEINADSPNATEHRGNEVLIRGGEGDDTIVNVYNQSVAIYGGNDNDTITNDHGNQAYIDGGSGYDVITNSDSQGVTIEGKWGADQITNIRSDDAVIDGGQGGDTLVSENSYNVTLSGGDHNDVLTIIGGDNNHMDGGAGYDVLYGGVGNETAYYYYADNKDNGDEYFAGDGFDILNMYFNYDDLSDLALTHGYTSTDDYMSAIQTKFDSGPEKWYGNLGVKLRANDFEQLNINVTDMPTISVADTSVVEGSSGNSKMMEFTVSLSRAADTVVSVEYTTAGVTANGVMNADFMLDHGSLSFELGETSKTIQIEVFGDNAVENDEIISVFLSNPTDALIADAEGIGTIFDNDVASTDSLAVPILNSKLDAQKVLYLDFDGAEVTNTAWNNKNNIDTINAEAFSKDSDTSSFNDAEKLAIESIFNRVSEDFNPFNVNVTTDYSVFADVGVADRLTAVITDTNDWYPDAGGVAYLYVEGSFSEYYKPAWVFSDALGNNARSIAEAISHELGHNLWLTHDGQGSTEYYSGHGSGETGWASIMGVGYYKNLTQWSQGEYSNATNQQDDIDIIEYAYGFREDDHGNDFFDATLLHLGQGFAAEGIIEQRTDVDVFKHVASDTVSFVVEGLEVGSNLDILANLYDSEGILLASSNPEDLLNASIEYTFEVETDVYLTIEGTGKGDPLDTGYTDYGSLGYYSVTVV